MRQAFSNKMRTFSKQWVPFKKISGCKKTTKFCQNKQKKCKNSVKRAKKNFFRLPRRQYGSSPDPFIGVNEGATTYLFHGGEPYKRLPSPPWKFRAVPGRDFHNPQDLLRKSSSEHCCLLRIPYSFPRNQERLQPGKLPYVIPKTSRIHAWNSMCLALETRSEICCE